jgi:hypothetical protein
MQDTNGGHDAIIQNQEFLRKKMNLLEFNMMFELEQVYEEVNGPSPYRIPPQTSSS